jgi:hypothetical protein
MLQHHILAVHQAVPSRINQNMKLSIFSLPVLLNVPVLTWTVRPNG